MIRKTTISLADTKVTSAKELLNIFSDHDCLIIRDLIKPSEVLCAKKLLSQKFNPKNDSPSKINLSKHYGNYRNFQKFVVQDGEERVADVPKCMRVIHNPPWEDDIYKLRTVFLRLIQIRNLLFGFSLNFASHQPENGYWSSSRIHHFPAGGGFMTAHRDDYLPVVHKDITTHYQPILIMSKKGKSLDCDFEVGGGFVEKKGERFYYEEVCELGDILIFDNKIIHGVSSIDPEKQFNQHSFSGRIAGFVTLYRKLI